MRKEMQLGFLGDPVGESHCVDELFGVVRERAGVGDSLAALVIGPAPSSHRAKDDRGTPGPAGYNSMRAGSASTAP
jgi:hypothetical protein